MLIDEAKKWRQAGGIARQHRVALHSAGYYLAQRWSDHAAVAALVELAGGEIRIEQAVQMFAKIGRWSRHAGPEPGMSGCRASPELLAKYGLAPDGRKRESQAA